jgi:phage shock protein PspC (stress-responsive transcriptional regulator)
MIRDHFQQLTELFDLDGRQSDLPARLNREVTELTELHEKLRREDEAARQSAKTTFLVLGILLAAITVALPLASLLPFEGLYTLLAALGTGAMVYGVSKVMRTINRNPAVRLRERMDTMYVRMLKDSKRGESYKLRQLRRPDRVIGGVAGELAQRLDLPPALVRMGFVIATFVSSGFFIPLYFIVAMILHNNREKNS